MNRLRWLYPGLNIKRWIAVTLLGIAIFGMGFGVFAWRLLQDRFEWPLVYYGTLQFIPFPWRGYLFSLVGFILILVGFLRLYKAILSPFLSYLRQRPLVEHIWLESRGSLGPSIVALGGGKDFHALLRSLKSYSSNLVAIIPASERTIQVETADSQFTDSEEPIHCLLALAQVEEAMGELLAARVDGSDGENTESFGRLLLRAIASTAHDSSEGLRQAGRVLAVEGQVIPATTEAMTVKVFRLGGEGSTSEGRPGSVVIEHGKPRLHVSLHPHGPQVAPDALMAILDADLLVVGPGSMAAHVLPLLLIEPVANAIAISSAVKMFVCGAGAEPDGIANLSIKDQLGTLAGLSRGLPFHFMVVNSDNDVPRGEEIPWQVGENGLPKAVVLTDYAAAGEKDGERLALELVKTYHKVAGRWARSRAG